MFIEYIINKIKKYLKIFLIIYIYNSLSPFIVEIASILL